jgi:hypothetical protein
VLFYSERLRVCHVNVRIETIAFKKHEDYRFSLQQQDDIVCGVCLLVLFVTALIDTYLTPHLIGLAASHI